MTNSTGHNAGWLLSDGRPVRHMSNVILAVCGSKFIFSGAEKGACRGPFVYSLTLFPFGDFRSEDIRA